jgi:hypothetical protein
MDANFKFAPGVRLLSGGKPIDVTTGHAAPYVYDFNKDGKRDLLVGEFGSGYYRGEKTTDNGPLANARLRVYLNTGTNLKPMYDGFKYLQADGENASVPSTFSPQFVNFDADGTEDLITGSIYEGIFLFRGSSEGGRCITNKQCRRKDGTVFYLVSTR